MKLSPNWWIHRPPDVQTMLGYIITVCSVSALNTYTHSLTL